MACKRLDEAGIEFSHKPERAPWEMVCDPDGSERNLAPASWAIHFDFPERDVAARGKVSFNSVQLVIECYFLGKYADLPT